MGAPAPLLRLGLVPQRHRLQHLDRLADLEAPGRGCHVRIPRHRCRHGSPLALPDGVAEELEQLVRIQPPLRKCRPSDAGAQTAAGRRRPGGGCGGVTLATQLLQPAAPIDDSVSNACRDRSLRGDHSLERAECLLLRVRPLVAPLVSRRIIVHELPAPRRRPFPPLLGGLPEAAACGGGGACEERCRDALRHPPVRRRPRAGPPGRGRRAGPLRPEVLALRGDTLQEAGCEDPIR
mmetsp:Transcript_87522/g.220226  ORF Transcript_87522/g.220226 Transcript_87522/m.220226 type:complete len:236 (-) Transcript_87522:108-815(-)